MAIQYQFVTDKEINDKVRMRRQIAIRELKSLGFEEMYFHAEIIPMLGIWHGLSGLIGTLIALTREESKLQKNLSVHLYHPVLASRKDAAYAFPFGMGVKFYTSFTDQTCIISANYQSNPIKDDARKLYKFARPCSIKEAWMQHKTWTEKLVSEGKQANDIFSFNDYVNLAKREDEQMLKPKLADTISSTVDFAISIAIFMSIIFFFVFASLLFPAVIANIYPTCWYVRNSLEPSLLMNFLRIFALLFASWFLARVQRKASTIDGVGTKFFGRTSSADGPGYISTKWLVFIFLPIFPVRSFRIVETLPQATMEPLKSLNWEQVKETLWRSKIWYGVILLIFIALDLWTVWRCL
jgi:hypothetical protein